MYDEFNKATSEVPFAQSSFDNKPADVNHDGSTSAMSPEAHKASKHSMRHEDTEVTERGNHMS